MTDHDRMCPQYDQTEHTIAMFDTPCRCEEYARVRADEFDKAYEDVIGRSRAGQAHAEAVAAKLVGVICEDSQRPDWLELTLALDEAKAQRDAARAERQEALQKVAALDDHLATLKRLDDADAAEINRLKEAVALRAEVAALQKQVVFLERHVNAEIDAGREVLADLRTKVDDRAHRAADIYREEGGTYWEGSMDAYGAVLTLIEEAGR